MDHNLLQRYYNDLFPFELLYKFLQSTQNREFTVTLQNNVYVRALSFKTSDEFKNFAIKKMPVKIDIGAIYKSPPEQGTEMTPYKKELIFDIDLTDYYRKCCVGKTICNKCFKVIKCAAEIMECILRQHFGYKDILHVFSGGRGLHIWVSDISSQYMNDRERNYIVDMITNKKPDNDIMKICMKYSSYFQDQDIGGNIDEKTLYKYLYVKLDKKVTSDVKHLLKSPFAIHPTSYKISVPIDIKNIENIDISDIPTLEQIVNNPEGFAQYIEHFSRHVN
ncbi:primase [Binucleata daphniae]